MTTLDPVRHDQAHRWPQFLPDGRHFVFMPWTAGTVIRKIQLSALDGAPSRTLFESGSAAIVAGTYLLYARDLPSSLLAQAFNPDLASFLLTSYYAACGVASIIAGRRLGMGRLRVVGLGLALYAAFKAVVEVTDIGSILLRVGAYAAVGVFLLGAGYLYREERGERAELVG